MVIFYDKDKELYYQVYVCVIDTQGDFDDFEITESFFTNLERSFDIERQAYCIDHESWEVFKKQMNEFINNTDSFIRTEDEERYYEIAVATPYYKVYDKTNSKMFAKIGILLRNASDRKRYFDVKTVICHEQSIAIGSCIRICCQSASRSNRRYRCVCQEFALRRPIAILANS